MQWVVVGLGNPGNEYAGSRHNTGRMAVELFAKKEGSLWREDKKANAQIAKTDDATLVLPDTYMNKSGSAVAKFVKSAKAAERLVVVYDDLDMPLGKIKISFDRSSGGHNGLKSVERALKTRKFYRVRIGVSGATAGGKLKKPQGEDAVLKLLLGTYKPSEADALKKVLKRASDTIATIVAEGPVRAMNDLN